MSPGKGRNNDPLLLLVVEDSGPRTNQLVSAARNVDPDGKVEKLPSLDELFEYDAEYLAEVDAFFIDFDLQTSKVPGYGKWNPLVLNEGEEFEVSVQPETGMSALLWLRQVAESPAYRQARGRHVSRSSHAAWAPGPTSMRVFSFVEAKDTVSRIFAAAAQAWFDAPYFNAQQAFNEGNDEGGEPTKERFIDHVFKDPERYIRDHFFASSARDAGWAINEMLSQDFLGNATWIPKENHPAAYDWYRIYLKHGGKARWRDLAEAIYSITDIKVSTKPKLDNQYQPLANRMQQAMYAVLKAFDEGLPDWGDWQIGRTAEPKDREDPMKDALDDSRLFWTADDVRVACQEHLRRNRSLR